MQINMNTNQSTPRFGMAVKASHLRNYKFRHFKPEDHMAYDIIVNRQKRNPCNIHVNTVKKFGRERLQAKVGGKTFVENIFRGPIKTLLKAEKEANKIRNKWIIQED